jgi:hypothetical protein
VVLKSVINRSITATRQKLSEIFPGIDFTSVNLSEEGREILALKDKIPTLAPTLLLKMSYRPRLRLPPQ